MFLATTCFFQFYSLAVNRDMNFSEICCMFNPLKFAGVFSMRSLNCQSLKSGTSSVLGCFVNFFQFLSLWPVSWTLTTFNHSVPRFELIKLLSHLSAPHVIGTVSCLEHLMHFKCSFLQHEANINANALFFIRNYWLACNAHNNKHWMRSNTKVCGCRTH